MSVTETTHQGYFSRLGNSFKGILFGLFLFFASIALLFWNEGRTVKRAAALKEGAGAAVTVDSAALDPAKEGKMVHFSGRTTVSGELADPLFGFSAPVLGLIRKVEMYQWEESVKTKEKINTGGSSDTVKTYTYEKTWSEDLIDSGDFKEEGHANPQAFAVEPSEQFATGVTVGAFRIPDDRVPSMGSAVQVPAAPVDAPLASGAPAGLLRAPFGFYYSATGATNLPPEPAVGDLRITLFRKDPCDVSFVAVQQGDTIVPYVARNGRRVLLQANGAKSKDDMFESAQSANKTIGNLLRIVGFFAMFLGLCAVLNPLKVLADVLPFLGRVVGAGTGIVAFLVALPVSLVTIAVAWLFYRPLVGIALLACAVAAIVALRKKLSKPPTPPS